MDNQAEDMSSKCDTTSLVEGALRYLKIINFVNDYYDIHCRQLVVQAFFVWVLDWRWSISKIDPFFFSMNVIMSFQMSFITNVSLIIELPGKFHFFADSLRVS